MSLLVSLQTAIRSADCIHRNATAPGGVRINPLTASRRQPGETELGSCFGHDRGANRPRASCTAVFYLSFAVTVAAMRQAPAAHWSARRRLTLKERLKLILVPRKSRSRCASDLVTVTDAGSVVIPLRRAFPSSPPVSELVDFLCSGSGSFEIRNRNPRTMGEDRVIRLSTTSRRVWAPLWLLFVGYLWVGGTRRSLRSGAAPPRRRPTKVMLHRCGTDGVLEHGARIGSVSPPERDLVLFAHGYCPPTGDRAPRDVVASIPIGQLTVSARLANHPLLANGSSRRSHRRSCRAPSHRTPALPSDPLRSGIGGFSKADCTTVGRAIPRVFYSPGGCGPIVDFPAQLTNVDFIGFDLPLSWCDPRRASMCVKFPI